jgi:hypothetical protein
LRKIPCGADSVPQKHSWSVDLLLQRLPSLFTLFKRPDLLDENGGTEIIPAIVVPKILTAEERSKIYL